MDRIHRRGVSGGSDTPTQPRLLKNQRQHHPFIIRHSSQQHMIGCSYAAYDGERCRDDQGLAKLWIQSNAVKCGGSSAWREAATKGWERESWGEGSLLTKHCEMKTGISPSKTRYREQWQDNLKSSTVFGLGLGASPLVSCPVSVFSQKKNRDESGKWYKIDPVRFIL